MKDKGPVTTNEGNIPMKILKQIKEERNPPKIRHHQRRTRWSKQKEITLRAEFGKQGQASDNGIICTPTLTHYLFNGTLGSSQEHMIAARFALDTGEGLKIIPKSTLPPGWESEDIENGKPPGCRDANGRPLSLGKSVSRMVKIAKTL